MSTIDRIPFTVDAAHLFVGKVFDEWGADMRPIIIGDSGSVPRAHALASSYDHYGDLVCAIYADRIWAYVNPFPFKPWLYLILCMQDYWINFLGAGPRRARAENQRTIAARLIKLHIRKELQL